MDSRAENFELIGVEWRHEIPIAQDKGTLGTGIHCLIVFLGAFGINDRFGVDWADQKAPVANREQETRENFRMIHIL